MAEVKATRSELLNLKRKIRLADTGHKLLKKKRDGLILEFFDVLKNARDLRRELNEKYITANGKIIIDRVRVNITIIADNEAILFFIERDIRFVDYLFASIRISI